MKVPSIPLGRECGDFVGEKQMPLICACAQIKGKKSSGGYVRLRSAAAS